MFPVFILRGVRLRIIFAKITLLLQTARAIGDIFPFLVLCGVVCVAVIDIFLYFRVVYKTTSII